MKIITPSFEIWDRDEQRGGLSIIERAGRICYKSKPGETPESAERFARGLIKRGHNSVLEHGDMIFEIGDYHIYEYVTETLQRIRNTGEQPPMLETTRIGGRCIVSGNIRAWRELFATQYGISRYFIGFFDPVFVQGWGFEDEDLVGIADSHIRQIFYKDLQEPGEKRAHLRQTVHFVCDRGVQTEFVRHRTMSFSIESTRYVDYSNDKFDVAVIEPCFFEPESEDWWVWKRQCMSAETAYDTLRRIKKRQPQECRDVLNLSTKSDVVVTANLRAWHHFFELRAWQTTGAAHPQAAELAKPLLEEMDHRFPDIFGEA